MSLEESIPSPHRRRILFFAHSCYLDDSNGATIASRAMLEALAKHGFAAEALTGTVLESADEVEIESWLIGRGVETGSVFGETVSVDAGSVRGEIPQSVRSEIAGVLINFGGDTLAREARSLASARGASVVFALHNFNYLNPDPFATADAVIVPSKFAADHYRNRLGLDCVPISRSGGDCQGFETDCDRRLASVKTPMKVFAIKIDRPLDVAALADYFRIASHVSASSLATRPTS